jgi:hypothetical protein
MITTKPMTMKDASEYLVTNLGVTRDRASEILNAARDRGTADTETFSVDYSLTGARFGRGHWTLLIDEAPAVTP